MADAILHIKDGYYFEVPKVLWRQNYEILTDVPKFLTRAHPDAGVAEFKQAMDGKILIPQPFGTLKNLYDAESGFCVSKFMVLELVVAGVLILLFVRLSKRIASGEPPQGKLWNLLELILVYIRDQIARPAIGGHDADRFVPLLWTTFFFILGARPSAMANCSETATRLLQPGGPGPSRSDCDRPHTRSPGPRSRTSGKTARRGLDPWPARFPSGPVVW